VPKDLAEPVRLATLFRQAAQAGWVRETSVERLRFFAAAERAQRLGARNPAGFFIALVHRRLWLHLSHPDEEAARCKLHRMPEFYYAERHDTGAESVPHRKRARAPRDPALIRKLIHQSLANAPLNAMAGVCR
jgi:hypothetical protein